MPPATPPATTPPATPPAIPRRNDRRPGLAAAPGSGLPASSSDSELIDGIPRLGNRCDGSEFLQHLPARGVNRLPGSGRQRRHRNPPTVRQPLLLEQRLQPVQPR